ncbi:MAG: PorT family protein [Chlorobi bacterium]|nr:PorT family protein [Chlorobiota bacterium]
MKKIVVLSSFLFLIGIQLTIAQKGKEVIFGLGGAFTNTWIIYQNFYGEPEVDYSPKMGYAFSLNLGYEFTEKVGIMTELQYSAQGQKYSGSQSWAGYNFKQVDRDIKLTYFNLPIFFKYRFGTGDTRFRFMAGPQFSFLQDATQDYIRDGKRVPTFVEDKDGNTFDVTNPQIKDRIENMDISVAIDIGADIALSDQFFINAGLRLNYGFKDVNTELYRLMNNKGNPYEPSNNMWGGLYVGINYRLDVQGYSQRSF